MLGRATPIIIAGFVFLALVAPAATADQNIPLPQTEEFLYHDKQRPIIIHLIQINTTDKPLNNVFPPENSENLKWVRLVYSFENTGDSLTKAYINVAFVDRNGNQYQSTTDEYTGESVLPHTITDPKFVEVAVPKNAEITQFIIRQGFYETIYTIPKITVTPVPAFHATPSAGLPTPVVAKRGVDSCLPFVPFAMAGGLAAVGIVINRSGIRRK